MPVFGKDHAPQKSSSPQTAIKIGSNGVRASCSCAAHIFVWFMETDMRVERTNCLSTRPTGRERIVTSGMSHGQEQQIAAGTPPGGGEQRLRGARRAFEAS